MQQLIITGATHQVYDTLLAATGRRGADEADVERDRGAVSLEQVLWCVDETALP